MYNFTTEFTQLNEAILLGVHSVYYVFVDYSFYLQREFMC